MIGSIASNADIMVYLQEGDLERLANERLEGIIIRSHKLKSQGIFYFSIDESLKNLNGFGIGIDDSNYWGVKNNFSLKLFISMEYYTTLCDKGKLGIRHRLSDGSHIDVCDWSKLDSMELNNMEQIQFYHDNKDKIPDIYL